MKAWFRCVCGIHGMMATGLICAVAGAVSWGQAYPEELTQYEEPPMSPQPPVLPNPPFTLPSPTPMAPEQAVPFVPAVPFAPGNPLGPAVPQVRLRVQAPARVEPDKEIEYRITVENVSAAAAHHVLVRDRLPRGVEDTVRAKPEVSDQKKSKDGDIDLLWELGTLKPGEQQVIVLAIKPKGNEDVQNRAYVQFEHGQKVTTRIAKPSVRAKVSAPAQAIRYEAITVRIEVANAGTTPLRDVVVTDELPAGLLFVSGKPEPNVDKPLTWKVAEVPPRQTHRIEYQAIANQTGTFRTNAKVTAAGGANAKDSAAFTVGEPKLKINISGPQRRVVNRPIPYHITVSNPGTVPLNNVQVTDELPPSVEFLKADTGGKREGGFVRWSLGALRPGENRSLFVELRASEPGRCWNEIKVKADHNLSDKALSGETHVESAARAVVVEIEKNTDSLVVGQKAIYTIRLFNPGMNNVLNPCLFVEVPAEMSISAERGATTGKRQGQKVQFDKITVLGKGEEKTYTIEVVAKKAGEAKLKAWWSDGRPDTGITETWEDKTIIHDPAQPPTFATKTQRKQSRNNSLSFPRSAWERKGATLCVAASERRAAERPDVRSHAEQGSEEKRKEKLCTSLTALLAGF